MEMYSSHDEINNRKMDQKVKKMEGRKDEKTICSRVGERQQWTGKCGRILKRSMSQDSLPGH